MATYSCAANQENIGESKCIKGLLENPNQIMKLDPDFTFTAAESNDATFWATAIKDKNAVLFPKMFNFEAAPTEAAYEETNYAVSKNNQGKYGWRIFYNKNLEVHKNMYSWDGDLDPIILFDDQGKMQSRQIGTDEYGGMTLQTFSVENQTIDENATKTPIRILLDDASEWNVDGAVFNQTFLKQVKSLSTVDLAESGSSTATLVTVDVTTENNGSPVRGLVVGDFTFGGNTIDSLTEPSAGQYALVGVGMTTDDLNLVTAPNITGNQFIESSAAITITIA